MASPIIKLPKRDKESIIQLIELSQDDQEKIIEVLEEVGSTLNSHDFINSIVDMSGLAGDKAKGVVSVLLNLYNVLDSINSTPEEFSEIFINSLEQYDEININNYDPDTLDDLKEFVRKCLTFHSNLGVTAKAVSVMTQHKNIFRESKLYTDIRPIFKSSSEVGKPQAAVIVHNLKIEYYEEGGRKSMHIAMDNSDIEELIRTLERAQTKYEFLNEFLEEANLNLLKE